MFRKLGALIAALVLSLSLAGVVLAATPPQPWPGRPVEGDNAGYFQCSVVAWAKIAGHIDLLVPNHCLGDWACGHAGPCTNGEGVYDDVSRTTLIGYVGIIGTWTNHDLQYVAMLSAFIPSSGLNRVYRGYNGGGTTYWTITRSPNSNEGCGDFGGFPGVLHDAQDDWSSTISSTLHAVDSESPNGYGGCLEQTSTPTSGGSVVDSGSPFLPSSNPNTVVGVTTGQSGGYLYFNPVYEGLSRLNSYFLNLGLGGANLCITSTCN